MPSRRLANLFAVAFRFCLGRPLTRHHVLARLLLLRPLASAQDWSCAGDDPKWHFLRESVYFVMHDEVAPLRTSPDRLAGLVPLWQGLATGFEQPERLAPGAPCPVGEVFFMLLDFVMLGFQRLQRLGTIDVEPLLRVLDVLQRRVSHGGALNSSWPLFGLLAIAQRSFFGLGGDSAAGTQALVAAHAETCPEGSELRRALEEWLASSSLLGAPRLASAAAAARRLHASFGDELSPCARDPGAVAALRLLRALGPSPGSRLGAAADGALAGANWAAMFFSGWPLFAALHRLQVVHMRDAACADAEPGAYGLLSRAEPESVWVCVRRGQDLVDERWRIQGTFHDCTRIAEAVQRGALAGCLFADLGANLGGCALVLARLGLDVLALEPAPAVARLLRAAVRRNGLEASVQVVEAAAGRPGAEQDLLQCTRGHSATCRVLPRGGDVAAPRGGGSAPLTPVRSVALDALLAARAPARRLCAVKIDVEGAEEDVLLGGRVSLRRSLPTLFLELHPLELRQRGSSPERVFDLLVRDLGYGRFEPLAEDSPPSCVQGGLRGNGTYPGSRWISAELLETQSGLPDACSCSMECFRRIVHEGCRCWDFTEVGGVCRMLRNCAHGSSRRMQAETSPPRLRHLGPRTGLRFVGREWWAGEMNGIWQVTAH